MRAFNPHSLTLRVKLTSIVLALVAFSLIISDIASVAALRSYMLNELDKSLVDGRAAAARRIEGIQLAEQDGTTHSIPRINDQQLLNDFFIEVRRADGTVDDQLLPSVKQSNHPAPQIAQSTVVAHLDQGPFTVRTKSTGFTYRAVALTATNGSDIIIVAVPMDSVTNATARLIAAEIIVTTAVLVGLGVAAWWIVRHEMRPLAAMSRTAGAIAAGDLSQRVEERDPNTEVGRLGRSFNAMISQIEASFAERQESEDRLRRFAADASHELRTPLTAIRGYAEIFRQGAIRDEAHLTQVMTRIEKEATRMGTMVEDLLMLARLDQKRDFEITEFDITRVLNDVVNDTRASETSHPIEVSLPDSPVHVDGDAARLHQVFSNLVTNAVSHTPAGTTVTIALEADDRQVTVQISDNGPGMETQAASRVFERFYRLDPGRSRETGGTGLGLSIVKAIVDGHGGTVTLTTAPGEGTTFEVSLPRYHV